MSDVTDLIAAGVYLAPHPIRWTVNAPHESVVHLTTIWQPVTTGPAGRAEQLTRIRAALDTAGTPRRLDDLAARIQEWT